MDTTLVCFSGYADCVEGAVEKGVVYGTGATLGFKAHKETSFPLTLIPRNIV